MTTAPPLSLPTISVPPISPIPTQPLPAVCMSVETLAPTDPQFQSASTTCEELAEKIARINADVEIQKNINDSILTGLNPIAGLINKLVPSNETQTMVLNTLKSDTILKAISNANSICKQTISGDQINQFSTPKECYQTIAGVCSMNTTDDSRNKCLTDMMDRLSVQNFKAINDSKNIIKCNVATTIAQSMENSTDLNTQAVMYSIQKASGLAAGSNSNKPFQCSSIEANLSSTQFSNAISCCMSQISTNQANLIGPCGSMTDASFSNITNNMDSCLQRSGVNILSKNDTIVSSRTDTKTEQKSEGINMTLVLIAAIIVAGICVLIAGYYYFG
jgi:hypothetical protein